MNNIKNHFLKGLLYIVPVAVTFWVLVEVYRLLNGIIGRFLPGNWQYLGILVLIVIITLFGYVGSVIITSPINSFFQRLLKRTPLLQTIYSSVKDLMSTFVGKKKGFNTPVLIKLYENSTIERIGFITNSDLSSLGIKNSKILVYLPHSYAFSGQLFVVDRSYITAIDKSSAEIMKLIVSGGVTDLDNSSENK
tara:strand:+ start:90 stop:668 length:579 start_codon:yes stop_codon:yes gene_type:complete